LTELQNNDSKIQKVTFAKPELKSEDITDKISSLQPTINTQSP
jgi:hypothetical protein